MSSDGMPKRFYPSGLEAPLFGPVTDDEVIREALEYAHEMMLRRDEMNAAVHCQSLRLSPVTRMVARALALQYVRMGVLADGTAPEVSRDPE